MINGCPINGKPVNGSCGGGPLPFSFVSNVCNLQLQMSAASSAGVAVTAPVIQPLRVVLTRNGNPEPCRRYTIRKGYNIESQTFTVEGEFKLSANSGAVNGDALRLTVNDYLIALLRVTETTSKGVIKAVNNGETWWEFIGSVIRVDSPIITAFDTRLRLPISPFIFPACSIRVAEYNIYPAWVTHYWSGDLHITEAGE